MYSPCSPGRRRPLTVPSGRETLTAPLERLASGGSVDDDAVDRAYWSIADGVLPEEKRPGFRELVRGICTGEPAEEKARGLRLNWQWVENLGDQLFACAGRICLLEDSMNRLQQLTGLSPGQMRSGARAYETAGSCPDHVHSRSWNLYPELICIQMEMEAIQEQSGDRTGCLAEACAEWCSAKQRLEGVLEALVESNLRLVLSVSRRFPVSTVMEEMDLIQEGCRGLMHAARRFDFQRGFRFSTYAVWWIRRYISAAVIRDRAQTGAPPGLQKQMTSVRMAFEDYTAEHGRHPTSSEIAGELGITAAQVDRIMSAESGQLSVDHTYGQGDGVSLGESLETDMDPPEEVAWKADLEERLGRALDALPQRERSIICLRFGLFDGEPQSLENVSRIFGVSRERIRQIQSRTLARLRDLGLDLPRSYEEEKG
jgi:RNA polymerase sigma factor (sigma-70 family)